MLEPFAGANNIVEMIQESGITTAWECFDIEPASENRAPEFAIRQRDTLEDFPSGCRVAVTNPPYLARNSAARRKMEYRYPEFDDLYKKCLDVMLSHLDYVAVIIPESFITAGLFHSRLHSVISLPCRMFDDTDCPVCLALFSPEDGSDDFSVFIKERRVGSYKELMKECEEILHSDAVIDWQMNDRNGAIGLCCIDNTLGSDGIRFTDSFDQWEISSACRSYTVISGLPDDVEKSEVITSANEILRRYREVSSDVFMTSFKGLRKDGAYRRRLDFRTAKRILTRAVEDVRKSNT